MAWFDGSRRAYFEVVGLPPEGVAITLDLAGPARVELLDIQHRVSGSVAEELRARRGAVYVPKHRGDRDMVITAQELGG